MNMGGKKNGNRQVLNNTPKITTAFTTYRCFYIPRGGLVFFCLLWTGASTCSLGSLGSGSLLSDGLWIAVWTRPSKEALTTEIQSGRKWDNLSKDHWVFERWKKRELECFLYHHHSSYRTDYAPNLDFLPLHLKL